MTLMLNSKSNSSYGSVLVSRTGNKTMPGVHRLVHIHTNLNAGEMCYSRDNRKSHNNINKGLDIQKQIYLSFYSIRASIIKCQALS